MQELRADLLRETTPGVTHAALTRLKTALNWAVAAELLPRNAAASVKLPTVKRAERRTWTKAQARAFPP